MDRVYFIDDHGQVIGTKSQRTPRKLKKRLKKVGKYQPPTLQGFSFDIGFGTVDSHGDMLQTGCFGTSPILNHKQAIQLLHDASDKMDRFKSLMNSHSIQILPNKSNEELKAEMKQFRFDPIQLSPKEIDLYTPTAKRQ